MKRLAIFIGGLLVLPAFAEVAPVFFEEDSALEYADGFYDENGFLIIPEEEIEQQTEQDTTPVATAKVSRQPVNNTPVTNRSTASRALPATSTTGVSGRGAATGNASRAVAARTTSASPRTTGSRAVTSRGTVATSSRGTGTVATRSNTTATLAAAARASGGASRTAATGTRVVRSGTAARTATTGRTTAARTATTTAGLSRAATTGAGRISIASDRDVGSANKVGSGISVAGVNVVDGTTKLYTAFNSSNRSGSVRRAPTVRMSSAKDSLETTVAMTTAEMDDLAELTDYCKSQYALCMDNYCNVLDDNQGRCSCSANLKSYAKAEAALKSATEELQDVAQKIQYIGLTKREVETLFSETVAEAEMKSKGTDNSLLQSSLDKVKDMIINVKSGGSNSTDNGLNFDLSGLLEFSFDSTGFDLASLFGTSNTNSVSNQRGEELYKTASARCKTSVLKSCTARGVDASIVTNSYDLEIDRECIMYERSLSDSNDEMVATVRNAKNVLQKARLMVAQQKNAYDMRGCINALDACMQDDFVCGSDYENCLDPTGRYIVNGAVVVGSQPGRALDPSASGQTNVMTSDVCSVNLYRTWDYPNETCNAYNQSVYQDPFDQNNAWGAGSNDSLTNYIAKTVSSSSAETASEIMSIYLQNKIGYNQNDRNYGMCMSVLNKCQDYTYTNSNGTYKQDNEVVKQYLARTLIQIKSKQDEILANYAETCISDVTSCLGQNNYPTEDPANWGHSGSTAQTQANIAINACRSQIITCMSVNGYSINTPTPGEMNCWVMGTQFNSVTENCQANAGDTTVGSGTSADTLPAQENNISYNVVVNRRGGGLGTMLLNISPINYGTMDSDPCSGCPSTYTSGQAETIGCPAACLRLSAECIIEKWCPSQNSGSPSCGVDGYTITPNTQGPLSLYVFVNDNCVSNTENSTGGNWGYTQIGLPDGVTVERTE